MSILTRDVDDIIFADLTDGDMDLTDAYDALFAYSTGQTQGTFEEFIETANNIGTSIVTALNLGDFESVRFADEAVRQLSQQGVLETRDVDDIIIADLQNGDQDLSTAYNALFALSQGQTQDTDFQQTINAANNNIQTFFAVSIIAKNNTGYAWCLLIVIAGLKTQLNG